MPSFKQKKIAVLYGGTSAERDVSLVSGKAVIEALNQLQADVLAIDVNEHFIQQQLPLLFDVDFVFIALHGGDGEGGQVQGALEMADICYSGSQMTACAIALNKLYTKQIWQALDLPTPSYSMLDNNTTWTDIASQLGNKVMIKPASEGSSIGMTIAEDEASFNAARSLALQYDQQVLVEQRIEGDEYTVSILGERLLPVIKLETDNTFYDYQAKYQSDETRYILPSGLSAQEEKELQALAWQAFTAVGAKGWGRVDVMRDADGQFYLLEVNTVPGLTDHSLVPMAAKSVGIDFNELICEIINCAVGVAA